jgi:hypothetical protein
MKHINLFFIILIVFLAIAITIGLIAGPTIVRDNRVTDLAITPVLGRGYSIGTNTYQSICLKDVQLTEPSYDMEYRFEESSAEKEAKETRTREEIEKSSSSYSLERRKGGGWGGGSSYSKYSTDQSRERSAKSVTIDGVKWFNHDIFVTIDLYSYYASVDESRSKMSDSSIALLVTNDIPGFFSSCGPFYVRSIGRKARFISKFTYRTREETKDQSFETKLKTAMQSFSTETKKSSSWGSTTTTTATLSKKDEQQLIQAREFSSLARERQLIIETSAYGLGKNEGTTLIAFDLDTFRNAIKDGFKAMQSPRTGRVATMEVVPWVENTEFQNLVKLESSPDEYEIIKGADGNPVLDKDGNPTKVLKKKGKLLYEKKIILTMNAEFIMEVERADRNLMNMYYKAKLCRNTIDAAWKKEGGGKLMDEFANRRVMNNRFTDKTMSLSDLDKMVNEDKINSLLKKETDFMYGPDGKSGANQCIRDIMDKGIADFRYQEHDSCKNLMKQMGEVQDELIEYYCMPVLAD